MPGALPSTPTRTTHFGRQLVDVPQKGIELKGLGPAVFKARSQRGFDVVGHGVGRQGHDAQALHLRMGAHTAHNFQALLVGAQGFGLLALGHVPVHAQHPGAGVAHGAAHRRLYLADVQQRFLTCIGGVGVA